MLTELEKEYFRELARKYSHLDKKQLRKLIEEEFEKLRKAKLNELKQQQALKRMENRIKDLKSSPSGRMWRGIGEGFQDVGNALTEGIINAQLNYKKKELLYELGLIDKKPSAIKVLLEALLGIFLAFALWGFIIYLLIKMAQKSG